MADQRQLAAVPTWVASGQAGKLQACGLGSFTREIEAGLKSELTHDLGRSRFRLWFRDVEVESLDGDTLVLAVPTEVHRSWIEYTFGDEVRRASERVLGRGVTVTLRVGEAQGEKRVLRERLPQRPDAWERALEAQRPKPTFSGYCAHRQDRWAVTLLEQLVHGGGPNAGPTIYLYGEPGSGKTHLLEALAGAAEALVPGECRYLTAKRFAAQVASAMRAGAPTALRAFEADLAGRRLVLLDGLEALESRRATQAELVRVLDRAALGGPRLVVSGCRHPRELHDIAPTLVSRLLGGPVLRLPLPDAELLGRILVTRAAQHGLPVPPEVVEAILARTMSSRAAVLWLDRWAVASRALGRLLEAAWLAEIAPPASTSASEDVVRRAKDLVAGHFGADPALLDRPTKARAAALPRAAALYLVWRATAMSLTQLARVFGFRSHSSASRGLAAIKRLRQEDAELEHRLDGLLARI